MKAIKGRTAHLFEGSKALDEAWAHFQPDKALVPSENPNTIHLFGDIIPEDLAEIHRSWRESEYHTSDLEFRKALEAATGDITILINSRGGTVDAGASMRSAIQEAQAKGHQITAHIVGLCASAAVMVAIACDEVLIADAARMMVHPARIFWYFEGMGSADMLRQAKKEVESLIERLKTLDEQQIDLYTEKTGRPREEIAAEVKKETWFSAKDAVEAGYADKVQKAPSPAVALADPPKPAETKAGPVPQKGVFTMNDAQIREMLNLAADTEITADQRDHALTLALRQRDEARTEATASKKELAELHQKNRVRDAEAMLDKHAQRGALTPDEQSQNLAMILAAPNFEQAVANIDGMLSDRGDESKVARQAQGTGQVDPKLYEQASRSETDQRTLAHQFKAEMEKHANGKTDAEAIAKGQDQAILVLGRAGYDAYAKWDFQNDRRVKEER